MKAIEQGVARLKMSYDELYQTAETIIKKSRDETQLFMEEGFIAPPPGIKI
jgi:malate dehydrogenase (oxaloacetate-decarboxylating)